MNSPRFLRSRFPEAERQNMRFVEQLLWKLGHRCEQFEAALRLFQFCSRPYHADTGATKRQMRHDWRFIAADAAATAVFLMAEDIEFIGKNLRGCEALVALMDHKIKRSATNAFDRSFPGIKGVRHSGQHDAKLHGHPDGLSEHYDGSGFMLVHSLNGDRLETDFGKQRVSLEISEKTLTKLIEVRDRYWSAFPPIENTRLV